MDRFVLQLARELTLFGCTVTVRRWAMWALEAAVAAQHSDCETTRKHLEDTAFDRLARARELEAKRLAEMAVVA